MTTANWLVDARPESPGRGACGSLKARDQAVAAGLSDPCEKIDE